jgi:DNA-binding NarL/FixJ family response regulator
LEADIVAFVREGASGFIQRATFDDFLRTIRAAGTKVLPPSLTGSLFSQIVDKVVEQGKRDLVASVRMTQRERDVIDLIAQGLSNKEIAQRLSIATYTVKSHVHNILEKLALHTRLQVASYAHTQGKNQSE